MGFLLFARILVGLVSMRREQRKTCKYWNDCV